MRSPAFAKQSGSAGQVALRMCSRCLMDESDPDIEFDPEGVCSHCRSYEALTGGHEHLIKRSARVLDALIGEIRVSSRGKAYDCVLGLSGGVDSSYLALTAHRLGLRPLAVHLDNGWNSELAVANIEKLIDRLHMDLVTVVLDWQEFRDLQVAFLRASTPDVEVITDHAIHAALYQTAAREGLRHVLVGTNVATEGGGVRAWSQGHSDWRYIRSVHQRFGSRPLRTYPHYDIRGLLWYRLVRRIRWIPLLDYVPYNKDQAVRVLQAEIGWTPYAGKHGESRFTRFFQDCYLPVKFGFDKRRLHLSSLIWSGQLTREQAMKEIGNAPDNDKAADELRYVIKKLELREEEFEAVMASPPKSFWDYPSYKRWVARFPKLLTLYHRLRR